MHLPVTGGADGNQVIFLIPTAVAAEFLMVDFKIGAAAAQLAAPAVALEHPPAKLRVFVRIEARAWRFWEGFHAACCTGCTCCRNRSC